MTHTIVMLSNRIYPSVSPLPAVLDPVYAQHLRAAGFKGLVISDAIWEISNRPVTVVQALKSVDIVLLPSPRQVNEAIPVILEALRTGQLNAADMRAKLDLVAGFKAAALARREPLLVDILH
ncbi:glycoside hydrolase family 3 N-terminal domain-containing protein [Paraburkholderia kururiensis]|uniref:glycoside hydrolase family 3 N-terminal domain-containing protein n=1 Tax=Paraburkholderia kururiensis TaxID=984307 RepID=UPI000F88172E|nr:glycoside hydrolase family 3 N-terminal domain-containing protein [Paraburkholderia kururiensis]